MTLRDKITVLMPSSPIPSHPSLGVITESIERIRAYPDLEDCEIIVTLDGVRAEQEHRRADYEEYKRALLSAGIPHLSTLIFDRHTHQAGMARRALDLVKTPLLFYVEHDTFPVGDIPWQDIVAIMDNVNVPVVRLHIFHEVLGVHAPLYGRAERIGNVPLIRTIQWSQRPHLASTDYYRDLIRDFFPEDAVTMIEDRLVGVVTAAPWDRFKLRIYAPPGNMTRSGTNNGRGDDPKYPMFWDGKER